jgi:hypothetical protein
MRQIQTARALVPLAATPEEQSHAHDVLRMADHEVDFEFAAALFDAASEPVPSTPEIKAILARISAAHEKIAELNVEIARVNRLMAAAKDDRKDEFVEQLDLANARLELNQDEFADAGRDLERAGGDPQSRIQRLVDEHKAAEQDTGGELDYSVVGKSGSARRGRQGGVVLQSPRSVGATARKSAGAAIGKAGLHRSRRRFSRESGARGLSGDGSYK